MAWGTRRLTGRSGETGIRAYASFANRAPVITLVNQLLYWALLPSYSLNKYNPKTLTLYNSIKLIGRSSSVGIANDLRNKLSVDCRLIEVHTGKLISSHTASNAWGSTWQFYSVIPDPEDCCRRGRPHSFPWSPAEEYSLHTRGPHIQHYELQRISPTYGLHNIVYSNSLTNYHSV